MKAFTPRPQDYLHVSKTFMQIPGEKPGDLPRLAWSRGSPFRHPEDSFRALWKKSKRSGGTWSQKVAKLFELQLNAKGA